VNEDDGRLRNSIAVARAKPDIDSWKTKESSIWKIVRK